MAVEIHRRESCRLCGAREHQVVLTLAPSALADDYVPAARADAGRARFPLECRLCSRCGNLQLADVVTASSIYQDYIYRTALSPGLVAHFAAYADQVLDRARPPAGSLVVDVGCNDGVLLDAFRDRGLAPYGVEPAEAIAGQVRGRGIPVVSGYFGPEVAARVLADAGPATLVTANNVMANVDDVQDFVQGVRRLLAPEGVFVFETGYALGLVENQVFDNIYHEHLSYFAVRPLRDFFATQGLDLFDAVRVPTKGGSLRGYVQPAGGPRAVAPAVAALVADEERAGLFGGEPYARLGETLARIRRELQELLAPRLRAGAAVAGYGASATCTTVLHHLELGEALAFLVDDNPLKQGTVSPGFHLPVFAPDELYRREVRDVVILPWRFADQIVAKHAGLLGQGGRFYRFLPTLEVQGGDP